MMNKLTLEKIRLEKARQAVLEDEYRLKANSMVEAKDVDRMMQHGDEFFRAQWLAFPEFAAKEMAGELELDEKLVRAALESLVRDEVYHLVRWEPITEQVGRGPAVVTTVDPRSPGGGRKPKV